jgi:hypothetical protein
MPAWTEPQWDGTYVCPAGADLYDAQENADCTLAILLHSESIGLHRWTYWTSP